MKTTRPKPAPKCSTTERLVDQIRARHHAGLKKYGVTVDREDLTTSQWIQHMREELLDALAYLQRIEDRIWTNMDEKQSKTAGRAKGRMQ